LRQIRDALTRIRTNFDFRANAALAHAKQSATAVALPGLGLARARFSQANRLERLIPVGLCLLLAGAAITSTLPVASPAATIAVHTAGTAAGSPAAAARFGQGDGPNTMPPADLYPGDGSIANVLERPIGSDTLGLMQPYVVQPGDTLGRIAGKFGLAATTIYWANKSALPDPQLLRSGQTLVIPPIDGLVVVAGQNDTLASIATRYGVASQDIIDANDLADPTVSAGETLLVPGAQTPPIPAARGSSSGGGSTSYTGRLVWPVPGHKQITQRFGCTGVLSEPPYGRCAHYHDAIDIGAPQGSAVVASAAGTVIYAGWKLAGSDGYGGGLVVWISHGGKLYTTYNHLSAEFVKVGQTVKAGQLIGNVGMTGNASGPHLHFEVWVCYPWTGNTVSCARNPLSYTG
jgi:murein DD-endopeptidase MepM/ murein hydrolase activator NlpD